MKETHVEILIPYGTMIDESKSTMEDDDFFCLDMMSTWEEGFRRSEGKRIVGILIAQGLVGLEHEDITYEVREANVSHLTLKYGKTETQVIQTDPFSIGKTGTVFSEQ
ncbi:MAG: hypothetical protein ABI758_05940 [Candidatus Woesebacteria bacterium]